MSSQNNIIEPFGSNSELPEGTAFTSSLDDNSAQKGATAAAAYNLKRMITGVVEEIDPTGLTKESLYIDNGNSRWLIEYAVQNDLKSVSYPLEGAEKIIVEMVGSGTLTFAIVTDASPVNLGTVDCAEGETIRQITASNGAVEIAVPSDADRVVFDWNSSFDENPFKLTIVGDEGDVIRMIREKLANSNNRIIVAASDTPGQLAEMASYRCTGTNDEAVLNTAIEDAITKGYSVYLLRGNYYLDSASRTYNTENDTFLLVDTSPPTGSTSSRSVVIEGESPAYGVVNLRISNTAYEGLDSSKQYSMLAVYDSTRYGGFVEIKNMVLRIPSNQKKVVGLDFVNYGGYARLHSMNCVGYINGYNGQTITASNPPSVAVEGCIGLRFIGKGPNGSYGSEITDTNISGFNEGVCINTEWTILTHVCTMFCVTGWVFGKYTSDTIHAQCHPVVLVCCGDERNVNLPVFYSSQLQNVDMIAFSVERNALNTPGKALGNLATEMSRGSFRGRIDFTYGQLTNDVTGRFWEYGHGHNMITRNMAHAVSGYSSVRNGYAPNYMQRFWDLTLNKDVICTNEETGEWRDAMGNIVDVD